MHVLGDITSGKHVLERTLQARRIVNTVRDRSADGDVTYVTEFTYAQVLSGYLSNAKWVVDVFDDPLQLSIRRPIYSPHQITSRMLLRVIDRADVVVTTLHPDGPRSHLGRSTRFALNGSPVSSITHERKPTQPPLRCVWVGKTGRGWGIESLLEALTYVDTDLVVDVYGEPTSRAEAVSAELGLSDQVRFHGNVSHEQVCRSIEKAHVGLCTLTAFDDFRYAYPIKIGEYLAAGAIPVMSDFPGMRTLAREAGVYTDPTPRDIATALRGIAAMSADELEQLAVLARERAEDISWENERERFAEHVFSAG
ncbi:glycosyltransferase [Halomarina halobia]|uniref:glycosyltransferase n=1 Tax=Halomarina halobia TaxID=3033386 RepID=UPI0023E8F9C8|nr:glycosyltransferase [Halomarina sp. PSR21]